MTKTKPHILDKDKEKFKRFLGWAAPYTPRERINKLRKAFASFGLTNRWIEFYYLKEEGNDNSKIIKTQGILTGCLWRTEYGIRNFCIELRDVHVDGKPIFHDRKSNKTLRLCFSAMEIYKINVK